MLLRRIGNKSRIAATIQQFFPPHKQYIELFFGAGGMFFNKKKAVFNIVNDNDSEVFNLFKVVTTDPDALVEALLITPIHSDLWNYYKTNEETTPVKKAVRFLMLSNYGYLGKQETLKFDNKNAPTLMLNEIKEVQKYMHGVNFMNYDFRDVFNRIHFRDTYERDYSFVYADPPYLKTDDNYETSFKEKDSFDLFEVLENSGLRWAMSEFNNSFVMSEAKRRGLYVNEIGVRQNLKNRRTEVLITNYQNKLTLF